MDLKQTLFRHVLLEEAVILDRSEFDDEADANVFDVGVSALNLHGETEEKRRSLG